MVFGGLGLATFFTLYLTPVAYLALARFSKPRVSAEARLGEELAQASAIEDLGEGVEPAQARPAP
ncbi:MAG: hypothetical protein ACPF9T_11495 [Pseudomonadales bacterium]